MRGDGGSGAVFGIALLIAVAGAGVAVAASGEVAIAFPGTGAVTLTNCSRWSNLTIDYSIHQSSAFAGLSVAHSGWASLATRSGQPFVCTPATSCHLSWNGDASPLNVFAHTTAASEVYSVSARFEVRSYTEMQDGDYTRQPPALNPVGTAVCGGVWSTGVRGLWVDFDFNSATLSGHQIAGVAYASYHDAAHSLGNYEIYGIAAYPAGCTCSLVGFGTRIGSESSACDDLTGWTLLGSFTTPPQTAFVPQLFTQMLYTSAAQLPGVGAYRYYRFQARTNAYYTFQVWIQELYWLWTDNSASNRTIAGEATFTASVRSSIDASGSDTYPPCRAELNVTINMNDCAFANPCLNGGTCVDGFDSVTCACAYPWTGPVCAIANCSFLDSTLSYRLSGLPPFPSSSHDGTIALMNADGTEWTCSSTVADCGINWEVPSSAVNPAPSESYYFTPCDTIYSASCIRFPDHACVDFLSPVAGYSVNNMWNPVPSYYDSSIRCSSNAGTNACPTAPLGPWFFDFDMKARVGMSGTGLGYTHDAQHDVVKYEIWGADTYPDCNCRIDPTTGNLIGAPNATCSGNNGWTKVDTVTIPSAPGLGYDVPIGRHNFSTLSGGVQPGGGGAPYWYRYWRLKIVQTPAFQPYVTHFAFIRAGVSNLTRITREGVYRATISSARTGCAAVTRTAIVNIDDCTPGYCLNGGTCVDGYDAVSCACVPGFSGLLCQTNINECVSQPCANGGSCVDATAGFTCLCAAGFSGLLCQTNVNECASQPCENGGTCFDHTNRFTCACAAGYSGLQCETNIDECASEPCQRAGTCVDAVNRFTCVCPAGYSGLLCQTDVNECGSNPCQHAGTCVDIANGAGFECVCASGYSGLLCQTNVNECASQPCLHSGTCIDGIGKYACTCMAGYSGVDCATNINECASNPCLNAATCVDGVNHFTCQCVAGYSSLLCQTDVNECSSQPCLVGGTCTDAVNGFTCTCAAGYSGLTCQTDVNECASNPCANGGTCADALNSFACTCAPGYSGLTCATDVNECASLPCQNGASCIDDVNSYRCMCSNPINPLGRTTGWNGTRCALDLNECLTSNGGCPGACSNTFGSYICEVVIHSNTLRWVTPTGALIARAPFQLPNVTGGQYLQFEAAADYPLSLTGGGISGPAVGLTLPPATSGATLYYGIASYSIRDFVCAAIMTDLSSSAAASVTVNQTVTCVLSAALGRNLTFAFVNSGSGLVLATTPNPAVDTFSVPAPYFLANSLRVVSSQSGGSNFINLPSSQVEVVAMSGLHFLFDPERITVTYGPVNQLTKYKCALTAATTAHVLVCSVEAGAVGSDLFFRISAYNQTAVSSDFVNYPVPPLIDSLSGCDAPPAADGSTVNCPTPGGVPLTITGSNFVPSSIITVGSRVCPIVSLVSTQIVCTLPPGTGLTQSVSIAANGQLAFRSLVSYAVPVISALYGCDSPQSPLSTPTVRSTPLQIQACNRTGGDILTLVGSNFGFAFGVAPTVFVGSAVCAPVSTAAPANSSTLIYCPLPSGNGVSVAVSVLQAGGSLNVPNPVDPPAVSYVQCPVGTAQAGLECVACELGRFSSGGVAGCSDCQPGTFANETATQACTNCPVGRFSASKRSIGCDGCFPGTYQDSLGQSLCKDCEAGRFSPLNGTVIACAPCPVHSFAANPRATACDDCLGKSFQLTPAQAKCAKCGPTEYLLNRLEGTCESCPDGCTCEDDGRVRSRSGYYVRREPTTGEIQSFTCIPGYCTECDSSTATVSSTLLSNDSAAAGGSFSTAIGCCALNRVSAVSNPLCGTCEVDSYEWGGECVRCDSGINLAFLYYGPDSPSIAFLSAFQFNVFNSSEPTCVAPFAPLEKLNTGIIMPLIAFGLLGLTFAIHAALFYSLRKTECYRAGSARVWCSGAVRYLGVERFFFDWNELNGDIRPIGNEYLRSFLGLLVFSYNSIVSCVVQFFDCTRVGDRQFMTAFPAVDCDSDTHNRYKPLYITLLVVVVAGMPIAIAAFLVIAKRRNLLQDVTFQKQAGILFESYRSERFFYEVFVLIRRTVAVAGATLLTGFSQSERVYRYTFLSTANAAFMFVHWLFAPYRDGVENQCEGVAIFTLQIITLALIVAGPPPAPDSITALLIALIAATVLLNLSVIVWTRVQQRNARAAAAAATAKSTPANPPNGSTPTVGAAADASPSASPLSPVTEMVPLTAASANTADTGTGTGPAAVTRIAVPPSPRIAAVALPLSPDGASVPIPDTSPYTYRDRPANPSITVIVPPTSHVPAYNTSTESPRLPPPPALEHLLAAAAAANPSPRSAAAAAAGTATPSVLSVTAAAGISDVHPVFIPALALNTTASVAGPVPVPVPVPGSASASGSSPAAAHRF